MACGGGSGQYHDGARCRGALLDGHPSPGGCESTKTGLFLFYRSIDESTHRRRAGCDLICAGLPIYRIPPSLPSRADRGELCDRQTAVADKAQRKSRWPIEGAQDVHRAQRMPLNIDHGAIAGPSTGGQGECQVSDMWGSLADTHPPGQSPSRALTSSLASNGFKCG